MPRPLKVELKALEGRIQRIAEIIDSQKGEDIAVLDLRGLSDFSDAFVIATARSSTHMQGLAQHIIFELRNEGLKPLNQSERGSDRWLLLDYGDVVIHLFDAEGRAYYDLEQLWADASPIAWDQSATA